MVKDMVAVRRLTDRALDPIIALAVTAFCLVVTIAIAQDSTDPFNAWTVVLILVIGGSLAFRSRAPEAALAVSVAGLAIYSAAHYAGGPIYLVPLFSIATIASLGDRRRTIYATSGTMLAFVAVGAATDGIGHLAYLLAYAGWLAGAVFLGSTYHNRRALRLQLEQRARDLEESQEEEARRRVAEERLRIARDLHDVIAHGVAAIHLQAGAALYVIERQPDVAAPALETIKDLSKQTLDELRATVGVLRADAIDGEGAAPRAPTPGIRQLDDLVEQARQAGLSVELQIDPAVDAVPAAVDVAAYRIVQESLTNVMRHAGPNAHAVVVVNEGNGGLAVEVTDDGLGAAANGADPPGHGLAGMRERAATVGGVVAAGPRPGGGFRVEARLPTAPTGPMAAPSPPAEAVTSR
jgi:signal transduction histidine kinase